MISGIESLHYGVDNVAESIRFFEDFGLRLVESDDTQGRFELPEGSSVHVRHQSDPALPAGSLEGAGVRQIVWAVDNERSLAELSERVAAIIKIERDEEGVARFLTPFGIAMGLRVFARRQVHTAPDPLNSPGRINRLNQHRKWRERAWPKVINHAVWATPDYEQAFEFMRDVLNFRLSDVQRGFGVYLRADGSQNHHSILLLNANAHFPGMDGKTRFHHANFGVEDIDELMTGANHMSRKGWAPSHLGLGRHRIDSGLFYYLPCPAGGEAEYGTDADYVDDGWIPRFWESPLFGFAHYAHNLPPFLQKPPEWNFRYLTDEAVQVQRSDP